ncbi:hypothetical protein [Caulobacter hibisci]|uniref:Uncharacterized protein n=1 Tax=Caulobacter hibisci TaxID=2035993 RepID=A0ABS0T175_9CAUL|nr:hypothetical protein [Caulobacter hibisci]MBI1685461.1 hypothetical protein [Caulobacter hibisci]
MSEESLIASHVYSRKLDKPKNVWPALIVTTLIGVAIITAYSLGQMDSTNRAFDPSELLNSRFLFSLVPCGVLALTLWAILYFGYVRWRDASMGPMCFNVLGIGIFGASVLAPLSVQGIWYVERQIALHEARQAWATVPALKTELTAIAARDRAGDAADLAVLKPQFEATDDVLEISPITIASQADVQKASALLVKTLAAMDEAEARNAERTAQTRAAIDGAIQRAAPPALVREHIYARLAADEQRAAAYESTLSALGVFTGARGLWKSDGENLMFARQSDVDAIEAHLREAKIRRYDLFHQPAERLPAQSWAKPQPGV